MSLLYFQQVRLFPGRLLNDVVESVLHDVVDEFCEFLVDEEVVVVFLVVERVVGVVILELGRLDPGNVHGGFTVELAEQLHRLLVHPFQDLVDFRVVDNVRDGLFDQHLEVVLVILEVSLVELVGQGSSHVLQLALLLYP